MAWSFRKRIKIAPGINLNLSKSGIGASIGPKGAKLSVGKRGTYLNTSIPGTGLYNRKKLSGGKEEVTRAGEAFNPVSFIFKTIGFVLAVVFLFSLFF